MELTLISYDKKKVKFGKTLCSIGVVFLISNSIPYLWENYGMIIVYPALLIILIGLGFIGVYTNKISKVGRIIFTNDSTTILKENSKYVLINMEYFVEFSNSGYRGKDSFKNYLMFGSIATNPGINSIKFIKANTKLDCEVLINSKNDMIKVQEVLNTYFKKTYEKV